MSLPLQTRLWRTRRFRSFRKRPADDSDDDLDLLEITDGLERDRTAIRQIYLALWGLKDHGADPADLDAVGGLIIALEERLENRRDQVELLREVEAQRDDALALAAPAHAGRHRDASLVRAWAEWQAAKRASMDAPADLPEGEDRRLTRALDEAERQIEELYPSTPLGLAIKLRYLFHEVGATDRNVQRTLAHGEPITDDMLPDPTSRLAWQVVGIAEQLARRAWAWTRTPAGCS